MGGQKRLAKHERAGGADLASRAILDPRAGDAEDDRASTKSRSLLAIGGSLISEISLPKLALAWVLLIALPGLVLGVAPLVAKIWLVETLDRVAAVAGIGSALVLALVVGAGWWGLPHLFRGLERSFWSLNSIAVQPVYVLCREALRHALESAADPRLGEASRRGCGPRRPWPRAGWPPCSPWP